ncbi:MAG TPA: hypothetical protein PJ982_14960, partial [Lacipirellulaceae bacterium]|nr:hypothetical protein [Lacipirellulaceae bacterium]
TIDGFLLADQTRHRRFLAQLYPRIPYRRALYVRREGRASVYAYRHGELPVDLRHECTHALLHANLPTVPLWLDEGLAEYFEMPLSQRAFDHPHLAAVRWNLRLGMVRTLPALEAAAELSQMGAVEYCFAWAWVHFMLHGPVAAHRELVRFVTGLQHGVDASPLSNRLVQAIPEMDLRMMQHFSRWRRTESFDA